MMTDPIVITGAQFIGYLPFDGQWRMSPALNGQCIVAADISGQHMPRLILDERCIALIGTDQQTYLEFLLDPYPKGRKH